MTLMIFNDAPPEWVMTRATEVETAALNAGERDTTLTFEAVDMCMVSGLELRSFTVSLEPADHVTLYKYGGTPSESAVERTFLPSADGVLKMKVVNAGLKGLVIDVYDVSSGDVVLVTELKVSLGSTPSGTTAVDPIPMVGGCEYLLVFTPLGSEGGSAIITWKYVPGYDLETVLEGVV